MIINEWVTLDYLQHTYLCIQETPHPRREIAEQLYAQMLGWA